MSFGELNDFLKYKKILRVQRKWLILLNLYKYFLKDMHMQDNIH